MRQKGFTLIELMVAISITAVLGTLGIVGFTSYNQAQVLQTSANEVVIMLNLAKSRAQSQIKPSSCTNSLNGYRVAISVPRGYVLYVSCSGSADPNADMKIIEQDKQLPTNLTFGANTSFFFPVQTGGVQTQGAISISNSDGKIKTITVNPLGGVSVQ
jgi:prepilin-type N-terminal cleavage/methylation domain-containing protein